MPRIHDDILSIKGQLRHIVSQADIGVDAYKAYMMLTKDYLADQAQFWAAHDDLKTLAHSLVEDHATHHQPQDWDDCLSTVRVPDGSHGGWCWVRYTHNGNYDPNPTGNIGKQKNS